MTNYSALNCPDPASQCFRTVTLAVLFLITFILCIVQITRIFINTKQLLSYQIVVLCLAAIESILGIIHWGFDPSTVFNFWMIYLKEIELVVITYFFVLSAMIAFQSRHLEKRVLLPIAAFILLFLTVVVIGGSFGIFSPDSDSENDNNLTCSDLTFIILSSTGLILSTVFLIAGILITRKMKKQSISENIRKKKRLELWALIFVYFVVSITSSCEDILSLSLNFATGDCFVFSEDSWGEVLGVLLEHVVNLLVPIWAILLVFNLEARREKGRSLHSLRSRSESDSFSEDTSLDYLASYEHFEPSSYYSVSSAVQ